MKHTLATAALLAIFAAPAGAACYADYKAKQDNPLQLHYGVARINGDCTKPAATKELRSRLASQRWTLLTVLTVFDDNGLAQRKKSAGQYYLRY